MKVTVYWRSDKGNWIYKDVEEIERNTNFVTLVTKGDTKDIDIPWDAVDAVKYEPDQGESAMS